MRVTLLENIHPQAVALFEQHGLSEIKTFSGALEGDELLAVLKETQLLGIRSKTQLTEKILQAAPNLLAVGCFCIGTDQVDLTAARHAGVAVFNAPYANTRSVAELVLGEIIMLMRRIPEKDKAAHAGEWLKGVDGACEVRGKTLGIVGYGHIGTQVSVLAENLGMRVMFYDVVDKLSLGNAQRALDLNDLLHNSDIVSLHVPSTPQTVNMIGPAELARMKKGAYLLNASRGNVVDLEALAAAIGAKHIGGAAIDVYPVEPANKGDVLHTPLQNLPNVILTPHIGGSTLEAQENIGLDVAEKLVRYVRQGNTGASVNLPQVSLPATTSQTRFRHIHQNVPGMLSKINAIFSAQNLNIAAQYLQTESDCGYVVIDVEGDVDANNIRTQLAALPGTIKAL